MESKATDSISSMKAVSTIILNDKPKVSSYHESFASVTSGLPKSMVDTLVCGIRAVKFLSKLPPKLSPEKFRKEKVLWDFVIQEANWLARDFYYERKWKIDIAGRLAKEACKYNDSRVSIVTRVCNAQTAAVMSFWLGVAYYLDEREIPDNMLMYTMNVNVKDSNVAISNEDIKKKDSNYLLDSVYVSSDMMRHCYQIIEMARYQLKKQKTSVGNSTNNHTGIPKEESVDHIYTKNPSSESNPKNFDEEDILSNKNKILQDSVSLEFHFGAPLITLGFYPYAQQYALYVLNATLVDKGIQPCHHTSNNILLTNFYKERKQIDSISGLVDNFLDFIEQPLHAIDPLVFNLHHEFSDESYFSLGNKQLSSSGERLNDELFLHYVKTKVQEVGASLHPFVFSPPNVLRDAFLVHNLVSSDQFLDRNIQDTFLAFVRRYQDLIVAICGLKRRQQTREIVKIGENEDVMALKGTQDELVCQKPKGYLPTDARLTELQREDNVEENVLILSRKKTRARPRNDRGVGDTEKRSCRLPDGAATSNKEATLYEELLLFLLSSLLDASRKPKRIPKLPLSIPLQKIQFGTSEIDELVGVNKNPKFTCGGTTSLPHEDVWEPLEDVVLQRLVQQFRYPSVTSPTLMKIENNTLEATCSNIEENVLISSSYWTVNWDLIASQMNSALVPLNRARTVSMCRKRWKEWCQVTLDRELEAYGSSPQEHQKNTVSKIPDDKNKKHLVKRTLKSYISASAQTTLDIIPSYPAPPRAILVPALPFISQRIQNLQQTYEEICHSVSLENSSIFFPFYEDTWPDRNEKNKTPDSVNDSMSNSDNESLWNLSDGTDSSKSLYFDETHSLEDFASIEEESIPDLKKNISLDDKRKAKTCYEEPYDAKFKMFDNTKHAESDQEGPKLLFTKYLHPEPSIHGLVDTMNLFFKRSCSNSFNSSVLLEGFDKANNGKNLSSDHPKTVRHILNSILTNDYLHILEHLAFIYTGGVHGRGVMQRNHLCKMWQAEIVANTLAETVASHLEILELRRLGGILECYGESMRNRSIMNSKILQLFVGDNLFEKHIRSVCETLTPSDDLDVKTISNKLDTPNDRIPIFELLRKYNINITRDLLPFHKSQLALYKARKEVEKRQINQAFWNTNINKALLHIYDMISTSNLKDVEASQDFHNQEASRLVSALSYNCITNITLNLKESFGVKHPFILLLGFMEIFLKKIGVLLRLQKQVCTSKLFRSYYSFELESAEISEEQTNLAFYWSQLSKTPSLPGLLKSFLVVKKPVLPDVDLRESQLWLCRTCCSSPRVPQTLLGGLSNSSLGHPPKQEANEVHTNLNRTPLHVSNGWTSSNTVSVPLDKLSRFNNMNAPSAFVPSSNTQIYRGSTMANTPLDSCVQQVSQGIIDTKHSQTIMNESMMYCNGSGIPFTIQDNFLYKNNMKMIPTNEYISYLGSSIPMTSNVPLTKYSRKLDQSQINSAPVQKFVVRPSTTRRGTGALATAVFRQPAPKYSVAPIMAPYSPFTWESNNNVRNCNEEPSVYWRPTIKHSTPSNFTMSTPSQTSVTQTNMIPRLVNLPFSSCGPLPSGEKGSINELLLPNMSNTGGQFFPNYYEQSTKPDELRSWIPETNALTNRKVPSNVNNKRQLEAVSCTNNGLRRSQSIGEKEEISVGGEGSISPVENIFDSSFKNLHQYSKQLMSFQQVAGNDVYQRDASCGALHQMLQRHQNISKNTSNAPQSIEKAIPPGNQTPLSKCSVQNNARPLLMTGERQKNNVLPCTGDAQHITSQDDGLLTKNITALSDFAHKDSCKPYVLTGTQQTFSSNLMPSSSNTSVPWNTRDNIDNSITESEGNVKPTQMTNITNETNSALYDANGSEKSQNSENLNFQKPSTISNSPHSLNVKLSENGNQPNVKNTQKSFNQTVTLTPSCRSSSPTSQVSCQTLGSVRISDVNSSNVFTENFMDLTPKQQFPNRNHCFNHTPSNDSLEVDSRIGERSNSRLPFSEVQTVQQNNVRAQQPRQLLIQQQQMLLHQKQQSQKAQTPNQQLLAQQLHQQVQQANASQQTIQQQQHTHEQFQQLLHKPQHSEFQQQLQQKQSQQQLSQQQQSYQQVLQPQQHLQSQHGQPQQHLQSQHGQPQQHLQSKHGQPLQHLQSQHRQPQQLLQPQQGQPPQVLQTQQVQLQQLLQPQHLQLQQVVPLQHPTSQQQMQLQQQLQQPDQQLLQLQRQQQVLQMQRQQQQLLLQQQLHQHLQPQQQQLSSNPLFQQHVQQQLQLQQQQFQLQQQRLYQQQLQLQKFPSISQIKENQGSSHPSFQPSSLFYQQAQQKSFLPSTVYQQNRRPIANLQNMYSLPKVLPQPTQNFQKMQSPQYSNLPQFNGRVPFDRTVEDDHFKQENNILGESNIPPVNMQNSQQNINSYGTPKDSLHQSNNLKTS